MSRTPVRAVRWAWVLVVVAVACGVATGAVWASTGSALFSVRRDPQRLPGGNPLAAVVGVLVGALIVSRHPRHRIGWLFCLGQLAWRPASRPAPRRTPPSPAAAFPATAHGRLGR